MMLLFAFLPILYGCATNTSSNVNLLNYIDLDLGINFSYPAEWGELKIDDQVDATYFFVKTDGNSESVLFMILIKKIPDDFELDRADPWMLLSQQINQFHANGYYVDDCDAVDVNWRGICYYGVRIKEDAIDGIQHIRAQDYQYESTQNGSNSYIVPHPGDAFIVTVIIDRFLPEYINEIADLSESLEFVQGFDQQQYDDQGDTALYTYENTKYGYKLQYPEDWPLGNLHAYPEVQESSSFVIDSNDSDFRFEVEVSEDVDNEFENCSESSCLFFGYSQGNLLEMDKGTFKGNSAYMQRWVDPEIATYFNFIFKKNDYVYSIDFSTIKYDQYYNAWSEFIKIINTFEVY